jgi:thioredoxin reductase (NADPH)
VRELRRVAGGGDSALQEALTLAEHCSSVSIVHHGSACIAQAAYRTAVEGNPGITPVPDSEIEEILGQDAVEGVRVRHSESGETTEIECAGVFVFVGLTPDTRLVDDDSILESGGAVVTDAAMRTRLPGLFAAGTVRAGHAGRAAAAAGDGALAAVAADTWLAGGSWMD